MNKQKPILGIIGGGQLGSMLAQAAKKIEIQTIILSDDEFAPAANYADHFIYTKYENEENIKAFINKVDVVTFEFENIPYSILSTINKSKPVLPLPEINQVVQDRQKEKSFVNGLGIKTTEWSMVKSKEDIINNANLLPGILKTCTLGYDGKGQYVINSIDDIPNNLFTTNNFILEKLVSLKKEISVVITRYHNGECSIYEPIENKHENQILKYSKIPADINSDIFNQAQDKAKLLSEKLNYVGTMCVEYFITNDNELLVNEIAPRVHNSGHLTIDAFNVSQFENHVRAVCDLEKITLSKKSNAEMINIIGKEINNYRGKTFEPNEFFYDYLKKDIKEKRKMGHFTRLLKS